MQRRTWILALCFVSLAVTSMAEKAHAQTVFVYSGELSQPSQSPEDSWFKEVELVDVNGDGWLDLVLPQKQPWNETADPEPPAASNIDHLYLNPSGTVLALHTPSSRFTFRPTVGTFPTAILTNRGYDVELGDLDGDGNYDLVRPERYGELVVLWGAADGTFLQWTDVLQPLFGGNPNDECTTPEDGNYDDVDLADVDGDGDLDIAVAQYDDCGRNFLVENQGGRTFQVRSVSPDELPAKHTHSVFFGDVDQDGAQDVLLANIFFGSQKPELYFGSGPSFDFLPTPVTFSSPGVSNLPTTVADLVDLDLDGRLDVYIAQFATGQRHGVYFHSGDDADPYPTFTPGPPVAGAGLYDARYADLDGDGDMEIVAVGFPVNESGTRFASEIMIASVENRQLRDAAAEFLPAALEGGIAVDLGDLDNDGDDDMVLGGVSADLSGTYSAAHIYENRTDTHLHDAVLTSGSFLALRELRADTALTVASGGNVTFEAGGGSVTFEAGPRIVLGAGFTAASGSTFTARILP